jgi:hypothetical protein
MGESEPAETPTARPANPKEPDMNTKAPAQATE